MHIDEHSPETELKNMFNYMISGVWPGSSDSNAYMQEIVHKIGRFTLNEFEHSNSNSESMAKELSLPCLYSNYKYPDDLSFSEYGEYLQLFEFYSIMHSLSRGAKRGFKFQKLVDTQLGSPQVLAKKWLSENKFVLGILNKINDRLVDLNPKLNVVNREQDNQNAELDFLRGVQYRRNPEDIDWFLKTRSVGKNNLIPDSVPYIESLACNRFIDVFINNLDEYKHSEVPKKCYWIVSPKTVQNVAYSLGRSIEIEDILTSSQA